MNLKIYKRGQGKNTRLWTGLVCFVIVAYGCWVLHQKLQASVDSVWVETLIPAALCAAFAGLIWWLSNLSSIADFLIAAEGEIKKVSWSSRKEIVSSTTVVIFVVAAMSIGIGLWDLLLHMFFDSVVNLY
jgi:preprotein translocase SecE subunit